MPVETAPLIVRQRHVVCTAQPLAKLHDVSRGVCISRRRNRRSTAVTSADQDYEFSQLAQTWPYPAGALTPELQVASSKGEAAGGALAIQLGIGLKP
jgi:hypothetical protein